MTGVNIHGSLGVCNDPIWTGKFQRYTPFWAANKAYELAQVYKAMPIYYGLWMARQMGPGQDGPRRVTFYRKVRRRPHSGRRARGERIARRLLAGAPEDRSPYRAFPVRPAGGQRGIPRDRDAEARPAGGGASGRPAVPAAEC
jgi:hypothetical protein